MPGINEVFRQLGIEATGSGSVTEPDEETNSATGGQRIPKERIFSVLSPVLRQYVGPMTSIICEEAMKNTSSLVSESTSLALIDDLAKNLHDADKAAQFRSTASQKIVSLFG